MSAARAIALVLGAAFAAISALSPAADSDAFWHLASGRAILAGGPPRVDAFSWTVAGAPVSTDQWLGQALLYASYALSSWTGLLALRSLAIFALIALVVGEAIARRPSRPLSGALAALPAIAISRFVWVARPELFGIACFAALLPLLRLSREGSARAALAIPPLLVVWAQLHGSFALGVVLTLVVALHGALREPARRARHALVALGALVATVATPAGLGTLAAPGFHLLNPPREIQEWSVPDPLSLPGMIWALALGATIAVAFVGPRARAVDALVLVPVALLSMTAMRQMPLLCIAAAPFLAERGPDAIAAVLRRDAPIAGPAASLPRRTGLVVGVMCVTLLATALALSPREPGLGGYPVAALGALPNGPGLLNNYDWGGWLIWYAPDTPVFIDGRLTPYLPDALDDYRAVVGLHADWQATLRRRGVRAVLVRTNDAIAVHARDLGWSVRASGPDFVLLDVPTGR